MPVEHVKAPIIEIAGGRRALGALKPDARLRSAFPTFAAAVPRLPRSAWVKRDFRHFRAGDKRRDQQQTSSCAGQASVTALATARAIAGMPSVYLSATFPYALVNGGRDDGASVSANMEVLKQLGTCSDATCGLDKLIKRQIPAEAYEEAKKYRLQEAYICRSFDDFGTALTLNYTAAIGIMIGRNFARLDRHGIAPLPDTTVGGHAMAVVGLDMIAGEWVLLLENSWNTQFGFDGGFCYITERHTLRMLDGFALVVPKESPESGDDEPPVVPAAKKSVQTVNIPVDPPEDASPVVPDSAKKAPAEKEGGAAASVPQAPSFAEFKAPAMASLIAKQKTRLEESKQEPAKQEPAKQEPANQEPANQEPANQEPANQEPANQEPAKPEKTDETHKEEEA